MLSRRAMTCVASTDGDKLTRRNRIADARKAFEKRRLVSVKENFNKLVMIATSDVKELTDFLKEIDEAHKQELMPKSGPSPDSGENIFRDP